ncbi:MAG: PDZ domain-containing protein [Bacteriovoracaceae bacterium]|jgi:predicted metalloprotease with PDZ domain|nr:hypothetical protein [Halobacteriovoraceae bacterium]MDP7320469.1 PDZ domain-containing protein [Bacteriovoracaceae bacterium]
MSVKYFVEVMEPKTHIVKVRVSFKVANQQQIECFLPSWSPGSYLMREYAKNIRSMRVLTDKGEFVYFEQTTKNTWKIDLEKTPLKSSFEALQVEYDIYCHELTVRTSHVDESHAFLHGPSYLLGIKGDQEAPQIEFKFSPLWAKLHTSLEDISQERSRFIYQAKTYDDLIDCPVEIGCHESDGFMHEGKEHHLVWYGESYPHKNDLKKDIQKIVETVSGHFSSIPYEKYMFITHFKRNLYGGLEHKNSTALHFDGRKLVDRQMYVNWLALVAHEYFHTWNVKRIRPKELGPFDYQNEAYTTMHWLTEGLTSFMDELFVLRSGLCTLEEYLKMQTNNLKRYFSTPGKKFHSLEQSSFNAWVKLYRPDENSLNSSISYYLKGGLVFSTLHFDFKQAGKNINDLLDTLWKRYLDNPQVGMETKEVMEMIEEIGGKEIRERFELRISTTEDIDFESYYEKFGMKFLWEEEKAPYLGVDFSYQGERVVVEKVHLDGPAFKAGINAKDEILAINDMRILKQDITDFKKIFEAQQRYSMTISRLGTIYKLTFDMGTQPRVLKQILVQDEQKAMECFH